MEREEGEERGLTWCVGHSPFALPPPQIHSLLCSVPWDPWKRLQPLLSGTQQDSATGALQEAAGERRSRGFFSCCISGISHHPHPTLRPRLPQTVFTWPWKHCPLPCFCSPKVVTAPAAVGLQVPQLPLRTPLTSCPHSCKQPLSRVMFEPSKVVLARTLTEAPGMFKASVEVKKREKGAVHPEEVMCGPGTSSTA